MKFYMFRTVRLSIIRRFSLYTQKWYTSYRFAVCAVKNSWWWTEDLSETCKVSFQNKFEKLVHLVGFIVRNPNNILTCQNKAFFFFFKFTWARQLCSWTQNSTQWHTTYSSTVSIPNTGNSSTWNFYRSANLFQTRNLLLYINGDHFSYLGGRVYCLVTWNNSLIYETSSVQRYSDMMPYCLHFIQQGKRR